MKDLTVIIPMHIVPDEEEKQYLKNALESIKINIGNIESGTIITSIVCPKSIEKELKDIVNDFAILDVTFISHNKATDYCSQVNYAAKHIDTDYFSILEFDDEYQGRWFNIFNKYFLGKEDVSIFLPLNIIYDKERTGWQYCNELVWANSFSNELGYIDFECLQSSAMFNLTGGIYNRKDFNDIGGFNTELPVAFNYEFMLRVTKKKLKIYVVPKEGYFHLSDRRGNLANECVEKYSEEEVNAFYKKARELNPVEKEAKE